jgi:hypothetical protein
MVRRNQKIAYKQMWKMSAKVQKKARQKEKKIVPELISPS